MIRFSPIRHRGRFFWRRLSEHLADVVLLDGRVARWTYRRGLQGVLSVSTHAVSLSPLRRLERPLTLAFVSDLHAGPTTDPAIYEAMFEELRRIAPDVLLLGGDFVSCQSRYVDIFGASLAAFSPPFGKFAVIGNHDLYAGDLDVMARLARAGVTTLVNRNVALAEPFASVSICGIDDPWIGAPDLNAAFAGARDVRVFLTHSPDGLYLLEDQYFDVALAGHTHGGQIALRDGTPIYVPSGPLCRRFAHGEFVIEGNDGHTSRLIVSRGIGCSTLPVRINADPEIIVCRLQ